MKKRLILLLLALCLALTLTGCGNGRSDGSSSSENASDTEDSEFDFVPDSPPDVLLFINGDTYAAGDHWFSPQWKGIGYDGGYPGYEYGLHFPNRAVVTAGDEITAVFSDYPPDSVTVRISDEPLTDESYSSTVMYVTIPCQYDAASKTVTFTVSPEHEKNFLYLSCQWDIGAEKPDTTTYCFAFDCAEVPYRRLEERPASKAPEQPPKLTVLVNGVERAVTVERKPFYWRGNKITDRSNTGKLYQTFEKGLIVSPGDVVTLVFSKYPPDWASLRMSMTSPEENTGVYRVPYEAVDCSFDEEAMTVTFTAGKAHDVRFMQLKCVWDVEGEGYDRVEYTFVITCRQ